MLDETVSIKWLINIISVELVNSNQLIANFILFILIIIKQLVTIIMFAQ